MKCIFCFLSALILLSCNKPVTSASSCSDRKRWDVKTLTDSKISNINFSPSDTAIADVIKVLPQVQVNGSTERFGIEYRTYKILCHIRECKRSSDGDYHLVLEDLNDATKTMIGEMPDFDCGVAKGSTYVSNFRNARNTFESYLEVTSQVKPGIYEITGVAFYDEVHGQIGVAPTGIEIHPILNIVKK